MIEESASSPPLLLPCQNLDPNCTNLENKIDSICELELVPPATKKASQRPSRARVFPKDRVVNLSLTYLDYYRDQVQLKTYKLTELKAVAKHNRLRMTGTKPDLISRIETQFMGDWSATQIQKNLRRFFVRRSFQLRGEAFKQRNICVNDTDFFTLEPLDEIHWKSFFSYKDDTNFVYGFNLASLMRLLKCKDKNIMNPYNRNKIPEKVIGDAIRLYLYMLTLFEDHVNPEDMCLKTRNKFLAPVNAHMLVRGYYYGFPASLPPEPALPLPVRRVPIHMRFDEEDGVMRPRVQSPLPPTVPPIPVLRNEVVILNSLITLPSSRPRVRTEETGVSGETSGRVTTYAPLVQIRSLEMIEYMESLMELIRSIRAKPLPIRIRELFMEIDQLGNYSDATWLSNLNKRKCFNLYGYLFDIWRFRGQLPPSLKQRICPLGDPFLNVMPTRMRIDEISEEQIRAGCTTVMENMVYSAVDVEDRKLGALLVLMALTTVSHSARTSLPWLYESL